MQRTLNPPPRSTVRGSVGCSPDAASAGASGTSAGAIHAIGATPGLTDGQRSNATEPLSSNLFSARVQATYRTRSSSSSCARRRSSRSCS
jgi:hypothetical protein